MNSFYVYVYIDPRNFEEFYIGKGKGSRRYDGLPDTSEDILLPDKSEKEKDACIAAIRKAGLQPIIRVIARNLSEHDALLIEKTLIWKFGRKQPLTNVSPGHYSENFRPLNTMHLELSGFDYQRGIYYYNVGDGTCRNWDDYKTFGFISAGQGVVWRNAMLGLEEGDVVAAYLKSRGFVGIGRITQRAKPIREVAINGKPLLSHALRCTGMDGNVGSDDLCEYVALVEWAATVERNQAKWKSKAGLYTTTHVRASLDAQPDTIAFLEREFGVNMRELAGLRTLNSEA